MAQLNMHDFKNLDELKDSLTEYVQRYNQSPHASLNGQSPQDRFFQEATLIIRLDEERIERPFCSKWSEKCPEITS